MALRARKKKTKKERSSSSKGKKSKVIPREENPQAQEPRASTETRLVLQERYWNGKGRRARAKGKRKND